MLLVQLLDACQVFVHFMHDLRILGFVVAVAVEDGVAQNQVLVAQAGRKRVFSDLLAETVVSLQVVEAGEGNGLFARVRIVFAEVEESRVSFAKLAVKVSELAVDRRFELRVEIVSFRVVNGRFLPCRTLRLSPLPDSQR